MLYHIFDLSNIILGILLMTNRIGRNGVPVASSNSIVVFLDLFRNVWGLISFVLGLYLLLFHSYCEVHDLTGIVGGLLILGSGSLLSSISLFSQLAAALRLFSIPIGIAAIIVGVLGLLDIHWLCFGLV